MISEEQEFGDAVYTSQCAVSTHCENLKLDVAPIIGRSILDDTRSLTETTCHTCCHGDLCNANCSASTQYRLKKDCKDLRNTNQASGVYAIQLEGSQEIIDVYCDMTTDGGGWTVFQRRVNGSVDFFQNFSSYENGFGNVHGEFWMGLKYIHWLTSTAQSELRIDLMAADRSTAYEVFPNFRLSASPNYTLHVDKGHGTAGDSRGFSFSNGRVFSTLDHEKSVDCSRYLYEAGWWYSTCAWAYLNGKYFLPGTIFQGGEIKGVFYHEFKEYEMLKETKMMFRRI
ncbi:microfibril-associated glycoprotein 4-like [Dreissena polymorpha]|uniref:microfibril-associated glycoprotein 4-like n=1 Tax=Dreissena polymorpha TaxID=45954 RepID=UPI0022640179|nr:microfibril-associated glycoprotein 4-like [Dreissena polymorpha]